MRKALGAWAGLGDEAPGAQDEALEGEDARGHADLDARHAARPAAPAVQGPERRGGTAPDGLREPQALAVQLGAPGREVRARGEGLVVDFHMQK